MKKTIQQLTGLFVCCLIAVASCKKADTSSPVAPTTTDTTSNPDVAALINLNAPENFNYETSNDITVDITILAPDNTPVKNIPVAILDKAEEIGGTILFRAMTDANGKLMGNFKLPSYLDQVVIDPKYLGVIRNAAVRLVNNVISCTLGGSTGYLGNIVLNSPLSGRPGPRSAFRPLVAYAYMGSYNNDGKPNYLESTNETISSGLLDDINTSLPERRPVMTYHPDYLNSNVETNANITATADVWVTFVTEGAGYRNTVAYFKYPTNNPPTSVSQVDSLHIIFPNASLVGSSGSLVPGNTVKLGRFSAGTSIGFALISNGWNGSTVGGGNGVFYSIDALNPESVTSQKRHCVFLDDNNRNLFLIGFEDINRSYDYCDHDFNDCVFYVKSNPVTAISKTRVNPIDRPGDRDGDGVSDVYDDFPDDPSKAYLNYYPSATTMGTHAFEDNWPYLGDYDMNDLVVKYRYRVISDRLNRPVSMTAKYLLQATGARFRNGFGVEFPFAPSLVTSATGSIVTNTQVVTLGANGCETGQSKAVIIPFDDAFTALGITNGLANTISGGTTVSRDTISMNLTFSRPLTLVEFGSAPFNPFIIINRTRGREAHFSGYTPTSKIDTRFYRMGADKTIPSRNRYYKTNSNLPWGLTFSENFSYPAEGRAINTAYTKFTSWVQSSGSSNANWYKDTAHTVSNYIYRR